MNLAEFKAWLEGYSASFKEGTPNAEQWAEVSKRISEVQPITVPPFAPYGSRPDDTMTKPIPYWQMPATCFSAVDKAFGLDS